MTDVTSVAPSGTGVWVPKHAILADMKPIIRYIQNDQVLRVVSEITSPEVLISEAFWDGFHDRETTRTNFFHEFQYEIQNFCGMSVHEFSDCTDILEDYIRNHFIATLPKEVRDEYAKDGLVLRKWLSPTEAILESTIGTSIPFLYPKAYAKRKIDTHLGNDLRPLADRKAPRAKPSTH